MYEFVTEILFAGLCFSVLAAYRALPVFAIVLGLDFAFGRRVPANYRLALWSLVCVRMLLPFTLVSPTSWNAPLDKLAIEAYERLFESKAINDAEPQDVTWNASANIQTTVDTQAIGVDTTYVPTQEDVDWESIIALTLVALWTLVTVAMVLRNVIAYVRFKFLLRRCPEIQDAVLSNCLSEECKSIGIRWRPRLREVSELTTPAVFGLLRSTICFPKGLVATLSENELRWVLRHELAHVRRCDAWLLMVSWFMRSIHWYNPVAWIVESRMKSLVEQSADAKAMFRLSETSHRQYGHLLLQLAESNQRSSLIGGLGLLSFLSRGSMRERVESLTKLHQKQGIWGRSILVALSAVLAAVGFTDASDTIPPSPEPMPVTPFSSPMRNALEPSTPSETAREYDFDIVRAADKLRTLRPNIDAERFIKYYLPCQNPSDSTIEDGKLRAVMTPSMEKTARSMLQALEIGSPCQITIETRIIQADMSATSGVDWVKDRIQTQGMDSAGGADQNISQAPTFAARLSQEQLNELVKKCQAKARTNILSTPKITMFNGQSGTIADEIVHPFLINVKPNAQGDLENIIRMISEGCRIGLQVLKDDNGQIELTCSVNTSSIRDVSIATLPYLSADGKNVSVQVPTVENCFVSTQVRLAKGESLIIASPNVYKEGKEKPSATFYVLTPYQVTDDLSDFDTN